MCGTGDNTEPHYAGTKKRPTIRPDAHVDVVLQDLDGGAVGDGPRRALGDDAEHQGEDQGEEEAQVHQAAETQHQLQVATPNGNNDNV